MKSLFSVLLVLLALGAYSQTKKSTIMAPKKVLFVVTSYGEIKSTGHKTGIWAEELATPYYYLTSKGYEVVLASPEGGKSPIDPKSEKGDFATADVKRFADDATAQQLLANTVKITDVKAADYVAIFYPGGHGPMWDLPQNETSIGLINAFYDAGKPVALVCHAPAALQNVKGRNGEPLIKGKKISGFTNSEEIAGQSTAEVPFMLEDMLKEKGAEYVRGNDWAPFAVADGHLITGQNPASAKVVVEKIVAALEAK